MGDARREPNVLVTGTPGTGKTTTAAQVAAAVGLAHVDVGAAVREHELHSGWDAEWDCHVVDEDKVVDELDPQLTAGGVVADYHSCDFFPERWFDLVVVLTAETQVLYERLQKRGYSEKKLSENMECEIMQVLQEEARESYPKEIVHVLPSNTVEDMESNVERIAQWVAAFRSNNR